MFVNQLKIKQKNIFMANQKELVNILKAELTLLAQEILQNIHQKDVNDLHKSARKLYEKMTAIYVLEKKVNHPEEILNLISGQTNDEKVSIDSPTQSLENDIEKIEETKEPVEKVIQQDEYDPYQHDITFVPKQKEKQKTETQSAPETHSFSPAKKMSIGLNDRIAFIKNLFNGDDQSYSKVIETLNAFDDYEKALKYVYSEVKPSFNNWEGKDEYEFRLIQLLELKFN